MTMVTKEEIAISYNRESSCIRKGYGEMYQQILETLLTTYGHLSYAELTETLRKDGLGEFVDAIENDVYLMGMMSEIRHEFSLNVPDDIEYGIIPSPVEHIRGIPVEYHGTFTFDHHACLKTCKGNCCKNKNYLMINITDIFRMLSSKAAAFFDLRSTTDLFDRQPPFLVLFYSEEYRLFLPYIRYVPIDADIHARPEDAKRSICPFLRPIHDVYAYHKKAVPPWTRELAMGCMLMDDKPTICRLSPLGKSSGMVTGRVTYEYLPPALNCPACETDVEVKVSEYLSSMVSSSEQEQQERFHKMLMSYHQAGTSQELDQKHFNEILRQIYHIDGLLSQYGRGIEDRPSVDQLVEIVFAASHGDFSVYEQFIEGLQREAREEHVRRLPD